MKSTSPAILLTTVCALAFGGCGSSEEQPPATAPAAAARETAAPAVTRVAYENASVEVGCGQCIYGMKGVEGCKTAAVVDGSPVLVAGEHADAHALGLCSTARRVVISGTLEGDRFVASKMELESGPGDEGG